MSKKCGLSIFVILTAALIISGCSSTNNLLSTATPTAELDPSPTDTDTSKLTAKNTSEPTETSTSTPEPTVIQTNTPTRTPIPTPSFTPTPSPDPLLLVGWREYTISGFHIALPEQWEAIDIDIEGVDAILNLLSGFDTQWAQSMTEMVSSEDLLEMMELWAMDTNPAGMGYANATVNFQSLPTIVESDDLCVEMPSAFQQMGVILVDSECGLEINDLDAGRFEILIEIEDDEIKQYQYFYMDGRKMWILALGVDGTQWSKFTSTFETIAESFRVDQ